MHNCMLAGGSQRGLRQVVRRYTRNIRERTLSTSSTEAAGVLESKRGLQAKYFAVTRPLSAVLAMQVEPGVC